MHLILYNPYTFLFDHLHEEEYSSSLFKPNHGTQDVTQEDTFDEKIEKAIKDNLNITTEELAKQFGVTSMTIKRHLAKMPHIRYVGSGYSGHWEVLDQE
ncbi:MAG: DeoR family transcriptional regulator, partial [Bacteroidaceae bacterium]|nr:DeoR family transcriptional regulator [Bacteroidaceae bacterium]